MPQQRSGRAYHRITQQMNLECKGCKAKYKPCVLSDNIPDDCPCQTCLVKVMCGGTCDEFDKYYDVWKLLYLKG